ncbi:TPA: hypothetical protein N0F65_012766 [Lagenidium giganteum]|uniref:Elongation factor Ts, mitochondrial n=1 Tax=Lagenidium giganteum TaxID=4803 RepID=A0AAV2YE82_9STRA|nr:TPA: hypothetical protein N0F65_012766 [Lagenidium giganteum]
MLSFLTPRTAVRAAALQSRTRCMSTYKPDINAIKKLRAASEAPLKDVKNALAATNGDFPAAFEWLRKKGIASATAKAGRTTGEGLIGVHISGNTGAMVEVNSETDFVAMNDKFQELVSQVSTALLNSNDIAHSFTNELSGEALGAVVVSDDAGKPLTVAEKVPELVGKVGENVVVRRGVKFQVAEGTICSYLHNTAGNGLGRAGAIVALEYPAGVDADKQEQISNLGKRLAMHIVAAKPKFLSREVVPEDVIAKERAFLSEQVKDSGKPAHIVEKMVDGRMNKFFSEMTLMDQDHFIEEGNPKVGEFVQKTAKSLGVDVKVAAYQRYEIGESKDEASA